MYYLFKNDPWGNKVPYMAVNNEEVATRLMNAVENFITKVVRVPRNVQSLIQM